MVFPPRFSFLIALVFDLEAAAAKSTSTALPLSLLMAEVVCKSQDIPALWCVSVCVQLPLSIYLPPSVRPVKRCRLSFLL